MALDLAAELGPILAGERAALAQRCHERSISMSHLHLMTLLDAHGPQPMSRVAEMIGSGLPTTTGLVSRMEERGLVQRVHDTDDRRVVLVQLTAQGAAGLHEVQEERTRRMARALGHLSAAERARLLASIKSLRAAFARLAAEQGAG